MKLLIIGDSHTLRLRNALPTGTVEDCYFGPGDIPVTSKCIQNHMAKTEPEYEREIYFSGHRGKTGCRGSYYEDNNYPCLEQYKDKDFVVLPWFGYIDVKQFLPLDGFKNPEFAVKSYIDRTLNYFKDNRVIFIEPLPQHTNILGFGSPLLPFEEREPYQKDFIKYLRQECESRGLDKPISIESILGVDKFDESYECHTCRDCLDPQYAGFKLDHPNKETFSKIIDGILKELDTLISN
jgi:hypothetical protein